MKIELINNTPTTILMKVGENKKPVVESEIIPGVLYNFNHLADTGEYITFHKENQIGKYIFKTNKYGNFPFIKLNNGTKFIEVK